jgi:hypothetical protein
LSPEFRYTKHLSQKILLAFHQACDQRDIEVAWELLNVLNFMAMKGTPTRSTGEVRRLIAAHERLWLLRHSETK